MNLEECLSDLAAHYNLNPGELVNYAYEDTIGGYHSNAQYANWPLGSIWAVEGQILYALVRMLKPHVCVELGTWHGCSATHIAAALHANGGTGRLYCVENGGYGLAQPDLVPSELQGYMTFFTSDAAEYMEQSTHQIDFVFEDSAHNEDITRRVWAAAKDRLNPGGVLISHDAKHFLVGEEIRLGIVHSGIDLTRTRFYLIAPSDCGLAIYRDSRAAEVKGLTEVQLAPEKKMKGASLERATDVVAIIEDAKKTISKRPPAKKTTPKKRTTKAKS